MQYYFTTDHYNQKHVCNNIGGLRSGGLRSGGLRSGGLKSGGLLSGGLMPGGLKSAHLYNYSHATGAL